MLVGSPFYSMGNIIAAQGTYPGSPSIDTHNCVNGPTFTVPVSGWYQINMQHYNAKTNVYNMDSKVELHNAGDVIPISDTIRYDKGVYYRLGECAVCVISNEYIDLPIKDLIPPGLVPTKAGTLLFGNKITNTYGSTFTIKIPIEGWKQKKMAPT